jgi:glycerophosphoryl diester phosphodiesterase
VTRQRLLDFSQTSQVVVPMGRVWMGFELKRKMKATETFALGTGTSELEFRLWTPQLVSHLKTSNPDLFLVLFGINKEVEWKEAVQLGVDAVFTDNPLRIIEMKNHTENEVESPAA